MKLLSSKIFVGYLLVIFILTGLILFFSYRTISNQYLDSINNNLQNINIALQPQVIHYITHFDSHTLDSTIKNMGKEINTRITILDKYGNVLADSKKDPSKMENHKNRPELLPIFHGERIGKSERFSRTVSDDMIYVALPIYLDNGEFVGAIRVSIFSSQFNKLINKLNLEILQSALIVVILSLIGVLIFSHSISKPINQISQASRKVAKGDFDVKVKIHGKDEINELAINFNNMTDRLKELFSEVSRKKDELNTLIKTIQEGLIAIDTTGCILLANKGLCDIVNRYDLLGCNVNDVFANSEVLDIYHTIINDKLSFTNEVELNNRFYLCSATFIETKKEAVLLFHDITEIKKLEQVKRDFVTNVSHELRTPLTAIKGFVETLEDELEGQHSHYIGIIKRHTNRLINIVQDLLILSDIENPNSRLMTSFVDIKALLDNVIKIFEQKVSEKKLLIAFSIEDDFPKIKIDAFKFEQVFINLIDNAIKYSDAGTILISIYKDDLFAYMEVTDSGMGISKDDLNRIFERFYIVDKSRSRKVGGTGLGLSIVKHIVMLHKGDISATSRKGEGTTFRIKLPLDEIVHIS